MPSKSFRPYTPSRRFITVADFSEITKTNPEKSLTTGLRKSGGRNNTGMVMVRHIGGGHRARIRKAGEQRGRHLVHLVVGGLRAHDDRAEEFEGRAVVEQGGGLGPERN